MNTAKVYEDLDGNKCSIWQMVRREPDWAANRIQDGEKAIEELLKIKVLIFQFLTKSPTRKDTPIRFSRQDVIDMVDALFHMHASDYRFEAKEELLKMMQRRERDSRIKVEAREGSV